MRFGITWGAVTLLMGILTATAADAQHYAYVGDYNGKAVHRFNGDTGVLDTDAYITFANGVEGMGGVGTTLFVATGNSVNEYDISGATASLIASHPIGNTLQMAVSKDGQYLYAAQSSAVRKYRLSDFSQIASASTPNSWGVVVDAAGSVYTNSGWSNGSVGIEKFDANLANGTAFLSPANATAAGYKAGAGLTIDASGNLWAVNGGNFDPNNGFVNEYDTVSGSLLHHITLGGSSFNRPFGAAIGPNGDVFVSSQGSGGCVQEVHNASFNLSHPQFSVSTFISNTGGGTGQSAKTIFFSTEFVTATPEPSSIVYAGAFGLGLLGMAGCRRKKSRLTK
jgi:hypothetical protein